ncbi:elastin-like [Phymastichus coffea]|uniref:elastin-like n=1 Tax=Phymastichus coffea TaxID=108790 RepID=UPI00273C9141|nr:elastin-like [Phymastichus coffea]
MRISALVLLLCLAVAVRAHRYHEKTRFDRSIDYENEKNARIHVLNKKPRIFTDLETHYTAYKDASQNACYLESTRDNRLDELNFWTDVIRSNKKTLYASNHSLTKIEAWRLAGGRIVEFCKGMRIIQLTETKPDPSIIEDPFFNKLPEDENDIVQKRIADVVLHPLKARAKRQAILEEREKLNRELAMTERRKRETRGRFRGQTQSQYMNVGADGQKEGRAEAEATQHASRAVVSGSSGMGQAQSMSTGSDGCDGCPVLNIPSSVFQGTQPGQVYPGGRGVIPGSVPDTSVLGRFYPPGAAIMIPGGQMPGVTNPPIVEGGNVPGTQTGSQVIGSLPTQRPGGPTVVQMSGGQPGVQIPSGQPGIQILDGQPGLHILGGQPGTQIPGGTYPNVVIPGGPTGGGGGTQIKPYPPGTKIPSIQMPIASGTYFPGYTYPSGTYPGAQIPSVYYSPGTQVISHPSMVYPTDNTQKSTGYPYQPYRPITQVPGSDAQVIGDGSTGLQIPNMPGYPSGAQTNGPDTQIYQPVIQVPGGSSQIVGGTVTGTYVPGTQVGGGSQQVTGVHPPGTQVGSGDQQVTGAYVPGVQVVGNVATGIQVPSGLNYSPGSQIYQPRKQTIGNILGGVYQPGINVGGGTVTGTQVYQPGQQMTGGIYPSGHFVYPPGTQANPKEAIPGIQFIPGMQIPGGVVFPGENQVPGTYLSGGTNGSGTADDGRTTTTKPPTRGDIPGTTIYPGGSTDTSGVSVPPLVVPGGLYPPGNAGQTLYPGVIPGQYPGITGGQQHSGTALLPGQVPGKVMIPGGPGVIVGTPGQTNVVPGQGGPGVIVGTSGQTGIVPGQGVILGGPGVIVGTPGQPGIMPGQGMVPGGSGVIVGTPGQNGIMPGQGMVPGGPGVVIGTPGQTGIVPGQGVILGGPGVIVGTPGQPGIMPGQGMVPGGSGVIVGTPGQNGIMPGQGMVPGGPGVVIGTSGQTGVMPGQPGIVIAGDDNADSQAISSVKQGEGDTMASATAEGRHGQGSAKSHVSGTYTGSGAFSAEAGTSDNNKSAQTQVSGGKEGAKSSAQGSGGLGKSQVQVELDSDSGATSTNAQSSGWNHGTNSQVQASGSGGMADAQANGEGQTSSQAQIGFQPYINRNEKFEKLKNPFRGGGSAMAQSGTYRGQSQSQLQGSFHYGISYTGAAQANSGSGSTALRKPFNFTNDPSLFKPFKFDKPESTSATVPKDRLEGASSTRQTVIAITSRHNQADKKSKVEPTSKYISDDEEYEEEYDDDDYGDAVSSTTPRHTTYPSSMPMSRQTMRVITDGEYEVSVKQQETTESAERSLPGYIAASNQGKVVSMAGKKTIAQGDGKSQSQTVHIVPANRTTATPKIEIKNPSTDTRSLHSDRMGGIYYGNVKTSADEPSSPKTSFVSVTNSVAGKMNEQNPAKKYEHRYYTKSSTCGYFTFSCNVVYGSNGRRKICKPKLPTYSDGTSKC